MLRICVRRNETTTVVELQGRLTGPWVAELARVWSDLSADGPQDSVVVDLADVTFVDEPGQELLTAICRAGATLTGAGCLTTSLLEDITRRALAEAGRAPAASPPIPAAPHHQRRHS